MSSGAASPEPSRPEPAGPAGELLVGSAQVNTEELPITDDDLATDE
jgi:hypothetical protein